MPMSDPVEILLASNRWATKNILDACRNLSPEQLNQEFEMGLGTIKRTLTHILGAMQGWGDLLAEREQRPRLEEDDLSLDELETRLDAIADDLLQSSRSHPVDEIVSGERGGRTYSFTRGAVLTHVTTHGMHHRAQCLNMLRQMGVETMPPSSVMEWTLMGEKV